LLSTGENTDWEPYVASGTTWEKVNDPCPEGWCVPTLEQIQSLNNAGGNWTANGRIFGSGANSIFLPAVGYRHFKSGELYGGGTTGYYWTSKASGDELAFDLSFGFNVVYAGKNDQRAYGYSVRCVAE